MSLDSCLSKQEKVKKKFLNLSSTEKKYELLIEMGRQLPSLPTSLHTEDRLVKGCQNKLYLGARVVDGKMVFSASTEALISAGLAALLIQVYSGEPPEALTECPPLFLKEIGLFHLLSPSRAMGLKSLYIKMQQEALKASQNLATTVEL